MGVKRIVLVLIWKYTEFRLLVYKLLRINTVINILSKEGKLLRNLAKALVGGYRTYRENNKSLLTSYF
jgi:hypothetical protein